MRCFLLVVAALRSLVTAGSIIKNKFDVVVEAERGDIVQGEGTNGVAVMLKPSPEATTMKTWSLVKESMGKIGDQVQKIMSVRSDMAMLQKDLADQQNLWKHFDVDLNQENARLKREMQELEKKLFEGSGAGVRREMEAVKQSLAEQQGKQEELLVTREMLQEKFELEVKELTKRKDTLTAMHKEVNETASADVGKAELVQLQLEKDAVTLRLTASGLKDKLRSGLKQIDFENSGSKAQQADLQRQLVSMQEGLKRIQSKSLSNGVFEKETGTLKAELKKEVDTMVSLQAEQQQVVVQCTKEMQDLDAIKCAEEAKANARAEEKTKFCNVIETQNRVLMQGLEQCTGVKGIGYKAQAPSGLMGATAALRDDERLMTFSPAPAASAASAAS